MKAITQGTESSAAASAGKRLRLRHVTLVFVTLALSGLIDVLTGYEVSVFLLYTVPVALATRFMGRSSGVVTALLATAVWVWADKVTGHVYSRDWILFINAANRLACFLLTVALVHHVRARQHALLRRLDALTGELPLCTQCQRVGAEDGYWRSFEGYLVDYCGATAHHKVCPDCARRSYARAAYRYQADQAS
jgi:hypothetical protein